MNNTTTDYYVRTYLSNEHTEESAQGFGNFQDVTRTRLNAWMPHDVGTAHYETFRLYIQVLAGNLLLSCKSRTEASQCQRGRKEHKHFYVIHH